MTAHPSFDLTRRSWVPVVMQGQRTEVSLREALGEAHVIDGLAVDDPLQAVAVLRQVLLPVVLHALGAPRFDEEWSDRFAEGRFDRARLEAYLDEHAGRFDLFDPAVPFAQVAGLATAKNETKPISQVMAHLASGNNVPLFSARTDADPPALTPAQAVRTVLAAQCWDTAAIKSGAVGDSRVSAGKTTGNPTGPLGQLGVVVPVGGTLFETLMLSIPILPQGFDTRDRPQWAAEPAGAAWKPGMPRGILDLLTWQSRRIRLIRTEDADAGEDVTVRRVVVCAGDRMERPPDQEPHTAWQMAERRTSDDAQWRPIRHRPGRSAWRGLATLVATKIPTSDKKSAPAALSRVAGLREQDFLPDTFPLKALTVGVVYGNQQAVIEDVVSDVLPLPIEALLDRTDNVVRETLMRIVGQAEDLREATNWLGDDLRAAVGVQKMPWDRGQRLGEQLIQSFDLPVRRILVGLQQHPQDAERAELVWRQTARTLALRVAEPALNAVPIKAVLGRPRELKKPWAGSEASRPFHRLSAAEARFRARLTDILGRTTDNEAALGVARNTPRRNPT